MRVYPTLIYRRLCHKNQVKSRISKILSINILGLSKQTLARVRWSETGSRWWVIIPQHLWTLRYLLQDLKLLVRWGVSREKEISVLRKLKQFKQTRNSAESMQMILWVQRIILARQQRLRRGQIALPRKTTWKNKARLKSILGILRKSK